jgi:hypothetical protein
MTLPDFVLLNCLSFLKKISFHKEIFGAERKKQNILSE